jgi:predicted permease
MPGAEEVATFNCTPFAADCSMMLMVGSIDGRPVARGEVPPLGYHLISGAYLRAMRIPLLAGRAFDSREATGGGAPTAMLVNAAAAKQLWPGLQPIGRRIGMGGRDTTEVEVIGVVGDARYEGVDQPARPAVYLSAAQAGSPDMIPSTLIVRADRAPERLLPSIRREILRLEPGLAISRATTAEALVRGAASSTRFITALLGAFAVAAAFLAAIGVYGVLAYMVAQRTREFGIRMAIGARPESVLALVLRQGAVLTAIGLALGLVGAVAASDLLTRFLYGVGRIDWPTYVAIVLLVGVVGIVAAYIPARRATRVDPLMALRAE